MHTRRLNPERVFLASATNLWNWTDGEPLHLQQQLRLLFALPVLGGIIATRGVITTFFGWFSVRTYQQTSSTVSTELRERSEENLNQKEMEREKALAAEQAENEKVTEDGVGEATALRRHRFAQTTRTKVRTKVKLKWWWKPPLVRTRIYYFNFCLFFFFFYLKVVET